MVPFWNALTLGYPEKCVFECDKLNVTNDFCYMVLNTKLLFDQLQIKVCLANNYINCRRIIHVINRNHFVFVRQVEFLFHFRLKPALSFITFARCSYKNIFPRSTHFLTSTLHGKVTFPCQQCLNCGHQRTKLYRRNWKIASRDLSASSKSVVRGNSIAPHRWKGENIHTVNAHALVLIDCYKAITSFLNA